jgi:hypothetical protein
MKLYELSYVSVSGLLEEDRKNLMDKVASFLPNPPTAQNLSGFLSFLEFMAEPEAIDSIEQKLKETSQIQRYLVTKKAAHRASTRSSRRVENFKKEMEAEKTTEQKVELQEIEKKLNEILKD